MQARALPDDLAEVVAALRHNELPPDFRGIPDAKLHRWLSSVGRKPEPPSRLKAFRLQASDLALLMRLRDELGISEADVLRRGLRALAYSTWLEADNAKDVSSRCDITEGTRPGSWQQAHRYTLQ